MRCQAVIGINGDVARDADRVRIKLPIAYSDAVREAGGIPILIPPLDREGLLEVLSRIDGVLLSGGRDMDPGRYGQVAGPLHQPLDPRREASDVALTQLAIDQGVPVLGICYGAQLINVLCGGDLIQDIPSQLPRALAHTNPDHDVLHPAQFEKGSQVAGILAALSAEVASRHHQAIGRIGTGLHVSGRAPDGVVEAIESTENPFVIGLQFHPERMDGEIRRRAFAALVRAAEAGHRRRAHQEISG